ncbi:MAG TPA: hypothetical protein VMJ34_21940 [Bryobacteraceae bacterium]|nr:hypothetical protein [Bryobacteraceae bacterium]
MASDPAEPIYGRLHDLAFDLVKEASGLSAAVPPKLAEALAGIIRLANARASAAIDPEPVEIAVHVAVEQQIDAGADHGHPASAAFLGWAWRELYGGDGLAGDLAGFESVYTVVPGRFRQVLAVPASYHRLMQTRPFLRGEGPVARLMAHAALTRLEIGALWSVSRALARDLPQYRELVAAEGKSDETGIFGNQALMEFCRFFLTSAIAEVRALRALLDPAELLPRVEQYCREELPEGSYAVLREVILRGELPRAEVETVVPFRERKARQISSALRERGLLVSSGVRAPLRIALPDAVAARWFPGLE